MEIKFNEFQSFANCQIAANERNENVKSAAQGEEGK